MLRLNHEDFEALARAAATDAANRHMRAAGRKVWNRDDYNVAAEELERISPQRAICCCPPETLPHEHPPLAVMLKAEAEARLRENPISRR